MTVGTCNDTLFIYCLGLVCFEEAGDMTNAYVNVILLYQLR